MNASQQASTLRPELTTLPERIKALATHRGYPVPWFVAWVNGEPEFRVADGKKWSRAVKEKLCWVCGQKLGAYLTFVLGPMCGITRTTSEPATHLGCAEWSVRNCPFMTRPHMVRREDNIPAAAEDAAGCPIDRNPGVTLLWTTRSFEVFRPAHGNAGYLIQVGDPVALTTWAEGRPATVDEITTSVNGGFPKLMEMAESEGPKAIEALLVQKTTFEALLPVEA